VVFDDPPAPNAAESPPEAWSGVMLRSLDWQQFGDTRCAIGDWPITEADATTISSRTGASSSVSVTGENCALLPVENCAVFVGL
jgi:hypothetical protein